MPAYYAMGYLSRVLVRITTIREQPHAKAPITYSAVPRHTEIDDDLSLITTPAIMDLFDPSTLRVAVD